MSWGDEFLALIKKKQKEEENEEKTGGLRIKQSALDKIGYRGSSRQDEEDPLGPLGQLIGDTMGQANSMTQRGFSGLIEEGALADGITAENVGKVLLGTLTDVGKNAVQGAVATGERIWDGAVQLSPIFQQAQWYQNGGGYNMQASQILEQGWQQAKEAMPEYIGQDLLDEEKIAKSITTDPIKRWTGVDADTDSVIGDRLDGYIQSAGDILARQTVGRIPGVGNLVSGLSAFGGEAENAYRNGATYEEAMLSGIISAAGEMGTEALFGGIKFGGKTLTEGVVSRIASTFTNKTLATLAKWGFNTVGEGVEEVLSGGISAVGQKLTYFSEKELDELFTNEDAWESFLGGMVVGGFFEGINIVSSKIHGQDYVSELSKNEKAVVDKVYQDAVKEQEAQKGKKLTTREKTELYDAVLEQMEKGYIGTDIIEEVLGSNASELVQNDRLSESYSEQGRKPQTSQADLSQHEEDHRNMTRVNDETERRLTNDDVEEYVLVGDRLHVRDGKQKILAEGDSPILTKPSEIVAFIRNALHGKTRNVIKAYGRVNNKLVSAVANATNGAVKINDYYLELDANRIAHMQDHVEQDKDTRNIPLTEDQIEQIPSYLDNFDDLIDVVRRKDGSVRLMLGKKINGHTIIVETVSKGRKALHPVTAYQIDTSDYIKKIQDKGDRPILYIAARKNGHSGYLTASYRPC